MFWVINDLCTIIIEYCFRFLKRNLMFSLIDLILSWIPFKLQFIHKYIIITQSIFVNLSKNAGKAPLIQTVQIRLHIKGPHLLVLAQIQRVVGVALFAALPRAQPAGPIGLADVDHVPHAAWQIGPFL